MTLDDRSAPELTEWTKVHTVWQSPPPDDRIHIFVKPQAAGEQRCFLNATLLRFLLAITLASSHTPAPLSSPDDKLNFFITIAAIDEDKILCRIGIQIRAAAKHLELQDHICWALKARVLIGEAFHSALEILPLQATSTLDDVKQHDLAHLRTQVQQPSHLPSEKVCDMFTAQPDCPTRIHFLVWLPPENHGLFLSNLCNA